jgi:Ca2+-binding RTX toxin-like protein
LSWSLSGTDAGFFTIDNATGIVTFKAAPDFEVRGDADADNIYRITVVANDGVHAVDKDVDITVTDVTESNAKLIMGTGKNDWLAGTGGNDDIRGLAGNDGLKGWGGNDGLDGGPGNDWIHGGDGSDTIVGGDGNDRLRGGDGNDVIIGGAGNDNLKGGDGADCFIFAPGSGHDSVIGFEAGDKLDLSAFSPGSFASIDMRQVGKHVSIDLGGQDQVMLMWTKIASLDASDLVL